MLSIEQLLSVPWEEISPIGHLDKIAAPLPVIHGANDPRVPIGEAEQIVGRLRARTDVEFIRFDDQGHSIAKLKNKLVAYPAAVEFLRRHLGSRRAATGAAKAGSAAY